MNKTEVIQLLIDFFEEIKCSYKVKLTDKPLTNNWDNMFIKPEKSYVEFGQTGPVRISEVEWIDINPIESIQIGLLVPDKYRNHSVIIINYFNKHSIKFSINDKIIRVIIPEN